MSDDRRRLPTVSLVVATFNEGRYIRSCLESILRQDYPAELVDIAVVDGGSTDGTPDIVREVAVDQARVHLLSNPKRVAAAGFNVGVRNTTGDIVSLAGAHSKIRGDYVTRLVTAFTTSSAALVGGRAVPAASRPTPSAAAIARVMASPFGVGAAKFRYASAPGWVTTAFPGAYRRWLFDRIGYFDENLVRNQDDEFHLRASEAGYRMWYDPDLVSTYFTRPSLTALGRQYRDYGRWRPATVARHGLASPAQLAPAALVLALAAAGASPRRARRLLGGTVASMYSAFLLAGMTREANRGAGVAETALVGPALATLHLSYGLGFWEGVAQWATGALAGAGRRR